LAPRGVTVFVGANKWIFSLIVVFKTPQLYLSSSPLYISLNTNYAQASFLVETIFFQKCWNGMYVSNYSHDILKTITQLYFPVLIQQRACSFFCPVSAFPVEDAQNSHYVQKC
jgi:hypothetical protein